MFPAIRPLVLVLKQCLGERSLSASYTGGLTSYALFLMVTRYVEEASPNADVGSLLIGFLDFYGNFFDPRACGISLRRRCYFNRLVHTQHTEGQSATHLFQPRQFDPLHIEDPLCEGNNAGRNCFRIYLIQRIWSDSLEALRAAMDLPDVSGDEVHDWSLLRALTATASSASSAASSASAASSRRATARVAPATT